MEEQYFNFPIQLLDGFMDDHMERLHNIIYYAVYSYSLTLDDGNESKRIEESASFLNVDFNGNYHNVHTVGKKLHKKYSNSPMTGINTKVYWNFRQNYKSEFEKVCLLGFLAFKSIIGDKAYCKVSNDYWFSRMDGNAKSIGLKSLSKSIKKHSTRRRRDKLKNELEDSWGLNYYSYRSRGFYISFELSYEELVFEAEKRRKSTKEKRKKKAKEEARTKALKRLGVE